MVRVLTVWDVYFPRVNGVSTSIASFRRALAELGVDMRLLVPRYADEDDEAGFLRLPGRRVQLDPEGSPGVLAYDACSLVSGSNPGLSSKKRFLKSG